MSDGNNTNIVHVNAIQGLLSEVGKHLKAIEPDESNVEQVIAKECAEDGLNTFIDCDIRRLKLEFGNN